MTWHIEPGSFAPLAQETDEGLYPVLTDQVGLPKAVFDAQGKAVWKASYSLWGRLLPARRAANDDDGACGIDTTLRFPGQWADDESGLHYNLNRYYDPETGQYLSTDPIGLHGGLRTQAYVHDPMQWIDPRGLAECGGQSADTEKITLARARQAQMLKDNIGYNISPTSWDQYPTIGRNGTFVSDKEGVMSYFSGNPSSGDVTISTSEASQIESDMGLEQGSLQGGFKVRQITGIQDMAPRSPLEGNQYFQGPGNHLPGGAPEMVINSIPTTDNASVSAIYNVSVSD